MRIKLKDKFNRFFDSYEREHIGYNFDKNYDKIRKSITKFVDKLDPKVRQQHFAKKFKSGADGQNDQNTNVKMHEEDEVPLKVR